MKVAIGSTNPVKVKAVRNVMKKIYSEVEIISLKVDSGVFHTPLSEKETIRGAINRAKQAIKITQADVGIGMEGGICKEFNRYFLQGWCAIVDREGKIGLGGAGRIELPLSIVKRVLRGEELGDVIDKVTGIHNIKRKMGSIGILTGGLTDRQEAWEKSLIYAMAKWLKPELYE